MRAFGQTVAGAGCALCLLAGAARSNAAGFASARFGGEHGNVTETNPLALYYNPGALGFSHGPISGILDNELAIRHATWTHTAPPPNAALSEPADIQVGNSGTASALNLFGAPAIAVTGKLDNLSFGIGFFAPFGGRAHWDTNDQLDSQTLSKYPRAADGVARWHIIDGEIAILYFTAGAGYRLGPLSVGASGNAILSQVTISQARAITGSGLPDTTNEGRATLNVSGVHGSYALGAMLEVVPNRFWLGASYQAQPGLGPQTLRGGLDIADKLPSMAVRHEDVTFSQALPDIYRGGARWRVKDDVELRLFGDYTRWSVMAAQCIARDTKAPDGSLMEHPCLVTSNGSDASGGFVRLNIPRNWNDTYGGRLGASYWIRPKIELFAGVGYETGASPDTTLEPGTMDGNNIGAALGARFMFEDLFYISASYTHLQFLDRDNTGKSVLATVNGVGVPAPTAQEDGGGKYTQWIGIIDVNLQKDF